MNIKKLKYICIILYTYFKKMETVSLQIISVRVNKNNAKAMKLMYLNKSPDFQREYEAWNDKLKNRFIESILLGRAMNPIWTVLNEDDKCEEILDGMHRVTTALLYFNDEFMLDKKYLTMIDGDKYDKKKFSDLHIDDQTKIGSYNFLFNKLDSSYRKDMNKLRDMYEILNRSSRCLNDYEFNKVLLKPFYDIIISHKNDYKNTFLSTIKDERGNIESEILEMYVLSDSKLDESWSSISNLSKKWIEDNLGNTFESVNEYVKNNGDNINKKLKLMIKFINEFYKNHFIFNSKENKRDFKKFFVPYKFFISRCVYFIKDISLFNRLCDNLIHKFKNEIIIDNIQDKLDSNSRNAMFQKKLIQNIDLIIENEMNQNGKGEENKRFFSQEMIQKKLKLQKYICPSCEEEIKKDDEYEGDHMMPWSFLGKTTEDNLQVLHKKCHRRKGI